MISRCQPGANPLTFDLYPPPSGRVGKIKARIYSSETVCSVFQPKILITNFELLSGKWETKKLSPSPEYKSDEFGKLYIGKFYCLNKICQSHMKKAKHLIMFVDFHSSKGLKMP